LELGVNEKMNRTHQFNKPFLRWAGSKRQLIPILSKYWSNEHQRYIEPFVGSGCLFFYLKPERSILCDINLDLVEAYKQVRNNLSSVLQALKTTKKGRDEYYRIRSLDPETLDPAHRAARFIYLNRFSFNGLYRTNKAGKFNVPYGGDKSGSVPSDDAFLVYSELLQQSILISGDFEIALEKARHGDFVYMDPPYSVSSRRVFTEYNSSAFGVEDIQRLKQWLQTLTTDGIEFLVSYAYSAEGINLAEGFDTQLVSVRRNIAGFSNKRREARELLISNRGSLTNRN
jgi:DNA adenine methylase